MDEEIKIGDVVTLKSDDEPYLYMTVDDYDKDRSLGTGYPDKTHVICKWVVKGEVRKASFNKLSLVYSPEQ